MMTPAFPFPDRDRPFQFVNIYIQYPVLHALDGEKRKKKRFSPAVPRRHERDPVARAAPRARAAAELPVRVVDEHQHPGAHRLAPRPFQEEHVGLIGVGEGGGGGGDAGDGGRWGGRGRGRGLGSVEIAAVVAVGIVVFVAFPPRHRLDLQLLLLFAVEDGLEAAAEMSIERREGGGRGE